MPSMLMGVSMNFYKCTLALSLFGFGVSAAATDPVGVLNNAVSPASSTAILTPAGPLDPHFVDWYAAYCMRREIHEQQELGMILTNLPSGDPTRANSEELLQASRDHVRRLQAYLRPRTAVLDKRIGTAWLAMDKDLAQAKPEIARCSAQSAGVMSEFAKCIAPSAAFSRIVGCEKLSFLPL